MPQGINTYGGGGAPTTTQTQINTGPAGPSGFYDASFMNFLQRRRQTPREPVPQEARLPTANERALDDARTAALIAQYKAESEPPPMYATPGGFNNPTHMEMDTQHMTGAQRAKYLPQNSQMVPSGGGGSRSPIEEDSGLTEQDKNAMEGQMISSRISNAGDARRQQYIKDRQLQSYYGTDQRQREDAPNQYGSGRG